MRRNRAPFNNGRYLLHLGTGEIHDLDREVPYCKIDLMNNTDVYNCESLEAAQTFAAESGIEHCTICSFCMPEKARKQKK